MKNLYKKGVSLIAVLLFMLVATIAATATFKWLSSEGLSSGSRMMQKEAYQSAVAGLENARTWMTFHANDVGSLIKQYKDGGDTPIKLDNQLKALTRAGQEYDVWLVGVNTEKSTYKLKFLSSGKARNGSVHSEVGIFNVDGLYQVKIPRKKTTSEVDFEEAFFGDLATAGNIYVNSAIITQTPDVKNAGGQALNDMDITDYLILDGNFYVNHIAELKDVYVTGHFGFCESVHLSGNLYVGGDLYPGAGTTNAKIDGSAYVKGGAKLNSTYKLTSSTGGCNSETTGSITIGQNATINGPIEYYDRNGEDAFTVNGNLVLNSYIDFPNQFGESKERIVVKHNTYIGQSSNGTGYIGKKNTGSDTYYDWSTGYPQNPTNYNFEYSDGYNYFGKTVFGSSADDKLYLKDFIKKYRNSNVTDTIHLNPWCSDQYNLKKCSDFTAYCNQKPDGKFITFNSGYDCYVTEDRKGWVGGKGTLLSTPPSTADLEFWGADPMESYAEKVNTRDPNCSNEIKNPIQFNRDVLKSSLIHSSSNLMGCDAGIFLSNGWIDGSWVEKVNTCYTTAQSRKELYNDEFLIIQTPDNMSVGGSVTTAFRHKIIWINPASKYHMYSLPPTAEGGQVFLYLPYGNSTDNGGIVTGTAGNYDYFIFSDGDIADFQMKTQIRGSLVMGNCSRLNTNTNNASLNISTDGSTIINDMASAAIICNNDGTNTCSNSSSTGEGGTEHSETEVSFGGVDSYYIANAPQLSVTLESQYKADEKEKESAATASTELQGDFVVVPRVIYMTKDPYGELSDYYNVLPLNGLDFNKENGQANCGGNIRTSGPLYERGGSSPSPLPEGYFDCEYEYNGKKVPFFVIVNGENGNAPIIAFKESFAEMGASDNHDVVVTVQPHATAFTLNFTKPYDMDKWSFSKESGVSCTENQCSVNIPAKEDGSAEISLFKVTTSGAGNGTATFQLLSGEGYVVGSPSTTVLSVSSSITVKRINVSDDDMKAFCDDHLALCPKKDNAQSWSSWPDCPNAPSNWVYAVGNGNSCSAIPGNNDEWSCGIAGDVSLQVSEDIPSWCVAIVPSYTHSDLEANKTYELPANIKAKPLKFLFGFSGSDLSGKTIKASVATRSADMLCTYGSSISSTSNYCEFEVFKGESIELSFPDGSPDNFNYWKCLGDNCEIKTPQSGDTYTIRISEDYLKVVAYFDETDKHCFFDEFKSGFANGTSSCTGKYCIGVAGDKWRVENNNDFTKIDYQHGYIAAKSNKSDNSGVKVMSQAIVGVNGTLKAQFQVPRVSSSENIPTIVANSGFILRSSTISGNDKYLFLNFYANADGVLVARLCDETGSTCKTANFSGSRVDAGNTVVTLTAEMSETAVTMTAMIGSLGSANSYSATIDLEGVFADGYRKNYEYMGFRLADPNFKLFDYGWRSETYGSECWDTYPTVDCSFKAAYEGGIVPIDQNVVPWVGLSSWFTANGCSPKYYYNGNDANTCSGGDPYGTCSDNYKFSSKGMHGYNDGDGNEILTAKAGVSGAECFNSLSDEDRVLAESEMAHCGTFWVGTTDHCTEHTTFFREASSRTVNANRSENFTLAAGISAANVRETELRVEVENADGAEMEIFLLSQASSRSNVYYSKTYITNDNGIIAIDVSNLFDADGFNPEEVIGVSIRNNSTTENVVIKSIETSCPYVVTLTCNGDLKYEAQKWKFTTNVTNYEAIESISIKGDEKVSSLSYDCSSVSDPCPLQSGATIKQATYSFEIDDSNNPFLTPGTYKFDVSLNGSSDPNHTCSEKIVVAPAKCLSAKVEGNKFIATLDKEAWAGTLTLYKGSLITEEPATGSVTYTYTIPEDMLSCETSTCAYKMTLAPLGSDDNPCRAEWTVAKPEIKITNCPENAITATLGEDVTYNLEVSGCGEGECTLSVNSGSISPSSNFNGGTITISDDNADIGNKTYTVTMSRDGAKDNATCEVIVNYTAPITVDCGPIEDQTGVDMGAEVSVAPHSVTGCNSNCSYTIKNGSTIVGGGSSVTNYDGGAMTMMDASNTSTGPITYSAVISKGGYSAKACTFTVKYNEPESALCDCKCARGCDGLTPGGNLGETSYDGCYFITEASRLSIKIGTNWVPDDKRYVKINGENVAINNEGQYVRLCWDNVSDCLTALENYSKVDGGWYIEMNASWVGVQAPSSYDPCAPIEPPTLTSCSGWPSSVKPGKTVSFTPTTTNCNVYGGCTYTITGGSSTITGNYTGGDISFNGESSEGSYTYHVSIKNKGGDGVGICDGSVTFDVNAPEQIFSKGSEMSASNGMRVWISESVTGSGLRCYHGWQTGNCTVYIEGSSKVSKTINNCNSGSGWNYIELPLTSLGSDRIATITFTNVEDGVMKCSVQ